MKVQIEVQQRDWCKEMRVRDKKENRALKDSCKGCGSNGGPWVGTNASPTARLAQKEQGCRFRVLQKGSFMGRYRCGSNDGTSTKGTGTDAAPCERARAWEGIGPGPTAGRGQVRVRVQR